MRNEQMIYIAGAISNGGNSDAKAQHKNIKYAEKFYLEMIHNGYTPFLPHLSHYPWLDDPRDIHWPRWIELDLNYIDACKGLVRLPNKSIGADMEVDYAKEIGIPVFFVKNERDMIRQLDKQFGKPMPRPELEKYINIIKNMKKGNEDNKTS